MAKKLYNLAVQNGKYKNKEGEEKNVYTNIGAVLEGDNGKFVVLERHINLSGFPVADGATSIAVSMFDANSEGQARPSSVSEMKDDVPF